MASLDLEVEEKIGLEKEVDLEVKEALLSCTLKVKPAIFSTEPVSKKIRDSIDYSIKITKVHKNYI